MTAAPAPRIVSLPAFSVVGMAKTYECGKQHDIPDLWGRFWARHGEIRDALPEACYGLCIPGTAGPDGAKPATFEYTACLAVRSAGPVPEGMVARHVPAQRYLVVTHSGPVSGIARTYEAIYRDHLPAAGLTPVHGPDFERYDERFDGATGTGEVDIHVPVA